MITLHRTKLMKQGRRLTSVDELTLAKCADGSYCVHGDTSRISDAPLRQIAGYKSRLTEAEGYRALRKAIAQRVAQGWSVTLGALSASEGELPYSFSMLSPSKRARERAFAALSHAQSDRRVVAGVERIRAVRSRLIYIEHDTPELAVAMSLAARGEGSLRADGFLQDRDEVLLAASRSTGTLRSMLIVLGVIEISSFNFSRSIGVEATSLVL